MDFSAKAVDLARKLSEESGVEATFLQADLYDLPGVLEGEFDIVFTSYGVLCWLPDLRRWGEIVARYVRPGGVFYMAENHPFASIFSNEADARDLQIEYPYFPSREPLRFVDQGSYADESGKITGPSYEWSHSLGEVVTSLVEAGLTIEFLHEFPYSSWARFPFMERGEDGWWRLKGTRQDIPMTFTVMTRKKVPPARQGEDS